MWNRPNLKWCTKRYLVKFIYSEKATQFCEISTLLLSYVVPVKNMVEIWQNVVAFSEYMNFTQLLIKSGWMKKNLSDNLVQKKKSSWFLDRILRIWSLWIVKLEIRSTNLPSKLRYNVNSYPCTTLLAKNQSAHTYRVSCKKIKRTNFTWTPW